MTLIPNVKPGDKTSQTSGNAGFLNRIIDGVNRGPQSGTPKTSGGGIVSALSYFMNRITPSGNARGDVYSAEPKMGNRSPLPQTARWCTQATADIGAYPRSGLWSVASHGMATNSPGAWYTQGIFPASVIWSHGDHEFCEIPGDSVSISGDGLVLNNRSLHSCADGSGRILDIADRQHDYGSEADRIAETGYTVTADDIADEVVFGEFDAAKTDWRPSKYFIATGSPGSVVWVESAVRCTIEKPASRFPGVQRGIQWPIDTVPSKGNRTVRLEFDFGAEEMLYNVPSGSDFQVRARLLGVYELTFSIQIDVTTLPLSTGVTSVTLSGINLLGSDPVPSADYMRFGQYQTTGRSVLRSHGLIALGPSSVWIPQVVIANTSGTAAEQASIAVETAQLIARPVRWLQYARAGV